MVRPVFVIVAAVFAVANVVNGLHFYFEGFQKKCFVEELQKDTVLLGNFNALVENGQTKQYYSEPSFGVQITVEEEESKHIILNQKSSNEGRFFFTSATSGNHWICFQGNSTSWYSAPKAKLSMELLIGQQGNPLITSPAEAKISGLAYKIVELNEQTADIRREQSQHREREAMFRQKSEVLNGHIIWYTLLQIVVVALTCVWQIRHLKKFFQAKKLV